MAGEIPSAWLRELVAACERRDVDVDTVLRRHRVDRRALTERSGRADWATIVDVLALLEAKGGDDLLTRIGESYGAGYAAGRVLASLVLSPRLWLELMLKLSNAAGHRHMSFVWGDHPDGRFWFNTWMNDGYEDCRAFFVWTIGFLRGPTLLLELPPPKIEAKIGPRRGEYLVTYPKRRTPREALFDVAGVIRSDLVFAELLEYAPSFLPAVSGGMLRDAVLAEPVRESRVLALQRDHGLTHAEARVAVRLSEGLRLPEIAVDLGVSVETVRTHLKRSYDKTSARSQAQLVTLVHRLRR